MSLIKIFKYSLVVAVIAFTTRIVFAAPSISPITSPSSVKGTIEVVSMLYPTFGQGDTPGLYITKCVKAGKTLAQFVTCNNQLLDTSLPTPQNLAIRGYGLHVLSKLIAQAYHISNDDASKMMFDSLDKKTGDIIIQSMVVDQNVGTLTGTFSTGSVSIR